MNHRFPIFFGVLIAALFLLGQTVFIVDETKQALVLQFGENKRTIRDAGLYFKTPLIQQTVFFEKRVLDVDPDPERVLLASTNDGFMKKLAVDPLKDKNNEDKNNNSDDNGSPIIVDTFARYRIVDPLKFRQRLGTEDGARVRISNEMNSTTRDVLGRTTLEKLLSSQRAQLMERIKTRVNTALMHMGVEIVDVRINRADLTDSIERATFNRMTTEREQRAAEIRSIGEKRALEIRSNAEKDRTVLIAEAQRQAQTLRGQGDEEASKIYATAYQRDPDFYGFYRSLEVYKQTLGRKETTLVLSPDSAFFDVLKAKP
jgi:membrane protease subunit HflC